LFKTFVKSCAIYYDGTFPLWRANLLFEILSTLARYSGSEIDYKKNWWFIFVSKFF